MLLRVGASIAITSLLSVAPSIGKAQAPVPHPSILFSGEAVRVERFAVSADSTRFDHERGVRAGILTAVGTMFVMMPFLGDADGAPENAGTILLSTMLLTGTIAYFWWRRPSNSN